MHMVFQLLGMSGQPGKRFLSRRVAARKFFVMSLALGILRREQGCLATA
jgi:hypothetical protein